jgi:hypothetical protein
MDTIAMLLPMLASVLGVLSILKGVGLVKLRAEKQDDDLSVKLEALIEEANAENEKQAELIARIKKDIAEIRSDISAHETSGKQGGFVVKDFLVYVVPGLVALVLVGLYAYLRMANAEDPSYTTPEDLNSLMTVVVGYLFGAGAASV